MNHLNPSLQTEVSGLRLKISSCDFLRSQIWGQRVDCPMLLPWSREISFTLQKTYSVALLEVLNTISKYCSRWWHFWGKHKQTVYSESIASLSQVELVYLPTLRVISLPIHDLKEIWPSQWNLKTHLKTLGRPKIQDIYILELDRNSLLVLTSAAHILKLEWYREE